MISGVPPAGHPWEAYTVINAIEIDYVMYMIVYLNSSI